MLSDLNKILIDKEKLDRRISEIGQEISAKYQDEVPIFVCILKGASLFLADLIRTIDVPVEIDFMSISSYGNSTTSSGIVKIRKDIDADICNRTVIIVEDIVDSGLSLNYIKEYLLQHKPKLIETCVLLDKPTSHKIEVSIDYLGFSVPDEFVVGYGLDYAEKYRNLPFIGILKKEIYSC